ncbi:MAG TPA: WD40 repeat domain-containing protein, partial [Thiotrichales bacterium]|nr:WD40 repeat domain-containing protein [Thiotrichales bacterium]
MKTSRLLGNMVIALFVLLNTAGYPANVNAETTGEKEILISRSDMLNVLASSAKSGKPVLTIDPKGHMAGITSIQYTHDGKLLLTASRDKTIRIWRTASGKLERTLRTETGNGSDGFISNIALSPDNRILAVNVINADLKPDIQLLDFKSGAVKQVLNGDSLSTPLVLAFSPDGKILASGSNNGEIILWNIKTGEIIHQFAGNGVMVSDINFSPDGKRLVSASWDKTASLWNVKTGKRISVLARHTYDLSNARFIQDGQFIVTSSYSTKDDILLWNGHTGAFVKTFIKTTSPDNTIRMATSNDGKFVAVTKGNFNKKEYSVAVYSAITGKLVSEFKGHDDGIIAMTFSPENKTIASAGGTGNEVYIWNPRTGRNSKELAGVASSIFSVGFSGGKIGWGKTRNKSVVVNADDIEYQFDLYNPSVRKTSIKNWGVGKTESGGYKASVIADPVLKVYIFKNGQKIYTVPPT